MNDALENPAQDGRSPAPGAWDANRRQLSTVEGATDAADGGVTEEGEPGQDALRALSNSAEYLSADVDDAEDGPDALTADIYPAIPTGDQRGLHLPVSGGRVSVGELEGRQVRQGTHPGDRVVRRARPSEEGFRRVGPGHLEALPRTLQPTTGVGRLFGRLKRVAIGSPLTTAAAEHERLKKTQALAVLSSDALSSSFLAIIFTMRGLGLVQFFTGHLGSVGVVRDPIPVPEFVAARWWEHLLHNQSALRLKGSLLFRPGIVVTSVPYHIASDLRVHR